MKENKIYNEVLEIISFFPEEEYKKIPKEKIDFFMENIDSTYDFSIDPNKDLSEQNISPETNTILIDLFTNYYATNEQKNIIEEILDIKQKKEEQEKREKYNPDDIFKKVDKQECINTEKVETTNDTALIEYKESFFTRFKNFIFKILHISK